MVTGTTAAVLSDVNVRVIDSTFPLALPDLSLPLLLTTTPGKTTLKDTYHLLRTIDDNPFDTATIEYTLGLRVQAQTPFIRQYAIYNVNRFDFKKATLTTGVVANDNSLLASAADYGTKGDNVRLELKDPGTASATESVSTNQEKITTIGATPTDLLKWTSRLGTDQIVEFELKDPGANSASLSITTAATLDVFDVPRKTVTVNLATDAGGTITTTSQDIITAVTADATANAWLTVAHAAGASDTLVVAIAKTAIPFNVVVSFSTSAASAITSTGLTVKNIVNADANATKVLTLVNNSTSDGTGVMVALAATNLSRNNTASSPVELSRALQRVWDIVLKDESLPQPYFLVASTHDNTSINDHDEVVGDRAELSDAVASRTMYYLTANNNNEGASAINTLAQNFISDRTLILAHTDADGEWAEAVLAGHWGAHAPGSFTTRYKRLNTIKAAKFTNSDIATMRGQAPGAAGAFTFVNAFGSPVTTGSWGTDGSFADWRRDKDWLELHVTANVFFLLRNKPKVLGDARGIAEIKNIVKEVFDRATDMGIIAQDEEGKAMYVLKFPTVRQWPVLDKARRVLTEASAVIHPGGAIEGFDFPIYADFTFFTATS